VSVSIADHIWFESRAWRIETFQTVLVPGLLQTPEHACSSNSSDRAGPVLRYTPREWRAFIAGRQGRRVELP
jgi:hypothetical protein